MSNSFKVSCLPDGGEFADGNNAALAWDVLRRTADHSVPDTLDLSACVHLKPYALACLCALAELAREHNQPIELVRPTNSECAEHLQRLGMFGFFIDAGETPPARSTNITVKRVSWSPGNEGERIVEVLAPRANLPAGMFPRMVEGLDEIILNALTHAESPIDCIVAGQAFPQTSKVEVAVVDLGRTIRGHLTLNPLHAQITTDQEAITLAMRDGVTGTPDGQNNIRGEPNSGAGLALIKEYCETWGGQLTVLNGDTWITCSGDSDPVTGHLRTPFQGCLVNIRYLTDQNLTMPAPVPIL